MIELSKSITSVQLLDKFKYGGGERVALIYHHTLKKLDVNSMLLGIQSDRQADSRAVFLKRNYLSYFLFLLTVCLRNSNLLLVAHSSRTLVIACFLKLICLGRIKVTYVQHLNHGEEKLSRIAKLAAFIDKFIVITPMTKSRVARFFKSEQLSYLNNYIVEETYVDSHSNSVFLRSLADISKNKQLVTFVGAVKKGKNAQHLIHLAAQLPEDEFHFAVVGDGEELASVRALAKAQKLRNITFCGYQNHPLNYLKLSDYLFFPSDNEMMPMVVLEAKFANCRVVGYKFPFNQHIIPAENLFEYEDFDSISRAMLSSSLKIQHNEFGEHYGESRWHSVLTSLFSE